MEILIIDPMDIEKKKKPTNIGLDFKPYPKVDIGSC